MGSGKARKTGLSQRPCLIHRKSTASEGRAAIFSVVITIIGLGVFQWFTFGWIWAESRLFVVVFIAIEVVVCSIVVCYAIINLRSGQVFECRMDSERLTCVSPVPGCGQSFSVPITEIIRIERELWAESCRWYIWTADGQRFWLTGNYGNPVEEFVGAIRDRVSDVTEFTT